MISPYKYHVYHINRYKKVFKLIQKCNVNARFIWAEKNPTALCREVTILH